MNEDHNSTSSSGKVTDGNAAVAGMFDTFFKVVRNPAAFFHGMPRSGGFAQPLIFMVVMGVASGLIKAILGVAGLLPGMHIALALTSIVLAPIFIVIFGFIGAAILFVIWKLMGSEQDYETAYRCIAYGSAISPLTQLLMAIPYLGVILVMAWWTLILVVASTNVHQVRKGIATAVFSILAVLMAGFSISAQIAAHRMESALHRATFKNGNVKDPAKAMQQLGKMFEQMGKATQEQQKSGQ